MTANTEALRRAAFLDRDGVINFDREYVYRREDFVFVPGALEGACELHRRGFMLIVITNQSGIGRGLYTEAQFHELTDWMRGEFASAGAPLEGVYYCPHHPTLANGPYRRLCECRKPAPGMLLEAAREHRIELGQSVLFGDRETDLEAARAAGVPIRVLLGTDGREVPGPGSAIGLATARFRNLLEAAAETAQLGLAETDR